MKKEVGMETKKRNVVLMHTVLNHTWRVPLRAWTYKYTTQGILNFRMTRRWSANFSPQPLCSHQLLDRSMGGSGIWRWEFLVVQGIKRRPISPKIILLTEITTLLNKGNSNTENHHGLGMLIRKGRKGVHSLKNVGEKILWRPRKR
jgi:hypothetical protein